MTSTWADELSGVGLGGLCASNRIDHIARAYEQAATASPHLLRHFASKASIFRVDVHRDAIVAATSRRDVARARRRVEDAKQQLVPIVREAELDRSRAKLHQLRESEAKYNETVAAENAITKLCLRVEEMGFESMQSIETDRLRKIFDLEAWQLAAKSPADNESDGGIDSSNHGSLKPERRDSSSRGGFDDPSVFIRKLSTSFAFGTSSNGPHDAEDPPSSTLDSIPEDVLALREKSHAPEKLHQIGRLYKSVDTAIQSLSKFADTSIPSDNCCLPDVYSPVWEYFETEKERALALITALRDLCSRLEQQRNILERNEASWKQLCDASRSPPLRQRSCSWDKGVNRRPEIDAFQIPTKELVELSSDAFRRSAAEVMTLLERDDTTRKELEVVIEATTACPFEPEQLTKDQIDEAIQQWSKKLQADCQKRLQPLEHEVWLSDSLKQSIREVTPPPSPVSTVLYTEQTTASWLSSMIYDSSDSLFGMKRTREHLKPDAIDTETKIFRDLCGVSEGASVIRSVACSCQQSFGRLFLLHSSLVFVSWKGRKFAIDKVNDVHALATSSNGGYDTGGDIVVNGPKESCRFSHVLYVEAAVELIEAARDAVDKDEAARKLAYDGHESTGGSDDGEVYCAEDRIVSSMVPILSGQLHGVSIQDYYEKIWSESTPFYKPWLEQDCFDVSLDVWTVEPITNQWCGESYQRHRCVRFKFRRRTHLSIGPPIANVKQVTSMQVRFLHDALVRAQTTCIVTDSLLPDGRALKMCRANDNGVRRHTLRRLFHGRDSLGCPGHGCIGHYD
jgi:hypothetical protein